MKGYNCLDYILTVRAISEECETHGRKIHDLFVDVHKAFDTNPRARLARRPQDIGMPNEMQWGIYPLYESVIVNIRPLGGCQIQQTTILSLKMIRVPGAGGFRN